MVKSMTSNGPHITCCADGIPSEVPSTTVLVEHLNSNDWSAGLLRSLRVLRSLESDPTVLFLEDNL